MSVPDDSNIRLRYRHLLNIRDFSQPRLMAVVDVFITHWQGGDITQWQRWFRTSASVAFFSRRVYRDVHLFVHDRQSFFDEMAEREIEQDEAAQDERSPTSSTPSETPSLIDRLSVNDIESDDDRDFAYRTVAPGYYFDSD